MTTLIQDLRYGLRQLRRSPAFTFVAVLTLALGIGANVAIFTLVNAVMLRSLPVVNPKQLYRLGDNDNCCVISGFQSGGSVVLYSYALYEHLRDHTPEFSELAAFPPLLTSLSVRRGGASGSPESFQGEFVSANYFAMFGIGAYEGRVFTPSDDRPGAPPVAVMSYRTWQQHFGLDSSVIGATLTINQVACVVAGIAPPGFYGDTLRSDPPDFWVPLSTEPALNGQNSILSHPELQWLYIMGRLKRGAVVAEAQSRLTAQVQQWLTSQGVLDVAEGTQISRQHVNLTPAGGGVDRMRRDYAAGLRLLILIASLVLLIACANIANLLLARGAASRPYTAVRMALGASRGRLIRQVLSGSVLLALLGGLTGLYVAFAGTRAILWLAFRGARYVPISATPSWPVLGFAFLLSLVTGIVFGVAPAWATSHGDPADALRGAGRSTRDHSSLARRSLVVVQVALSVVLLIGAGLLTMSLRNLQDQPFGFVTQDRVIVHVNPAFSGYKPQKLYGLYQQIQQRLMQVPGVTTASLSLYSPMEGENWSNRFYIEGHPLDEQSFASWDRVSANYFETVGTRVLRGRAIGEEDTPSSRRAVVINQTFARKFFPKENPIGKHFGIADPSHSGDYEIVGIVEDAKYQDARGPAYPMAFLPLLQDVVYREADFESGQARSNFIHAIELHVAGKPHNLEAAVRRILADTDPNMTVLDMVSFGEQVARNFNQDRLIARLTELFGLLALILACVGLYGVTSYSVARRTNEIGIRMAFGADRNNILSVVLRGALAQVILGLTLGIPVALAGGRLLSSELYGIQSYDPLVLGLAAGALTICALAAGFIPAWRASHVDPMVALRYE